MPDTDAEVHGRLKIIADLAHTNDQVLVTKLQDLQSDTFTRLRASYETQTAIEASGTGTAE
jgi:hypothetical protein